MTLADVEAILRPIWGTKTETATRLRSRIESVLDYAYVAEGIERRNPASYRGNLEHRGFAQPRKIRPVQHHAAAPYAMAPAIMSQLRDLTSTTSLCLRFAILTWARSMEARAATWSEISADRLTWTIPGHRMKANRPHQVPLCEEAREILEAMKTRKHKDSDAIFPGARGGLLSDVGMNKVLHALPAAKLLDKAAAEKHVLNSRSKAQREAKVYGVSVHGFRSSARSWGAARTNFAPFILEIALAHVNKDKVESAYQRDTVLETRRELMKIWGNFCCDANVLLFVRPSVG